jgi:hypothetical protein
LARALAFRQEATSHVLTARNDGGIGFRFFSQSSGPFDDLMSPDPNEVIFSLT